MTREEPTSPPPPPSPHAAASSTPARRRVLGDVSIGAEDDGAPPNHTAGEGRITATHGTGGGPRPRNEGGCGRPYAGDAPPPIPHERDDGADEGTIEEDGDYIGEVDGEWADGGGGVSPPMMTYAYDDDDGDADVEVEEEEYRERYCPDVEWDTDDWGGVCGATPFEVARRMCRGGTLAPVTIVTIITEMTEGTISAVLDAITETNTSTKMDLFRSPLATRPASPRVMIEETMGSVLGRTTKCAATITAPSTERRTVQRFETKRAARAKIANFPFPIRMPPDGMCLDEGNGCISRRPSTETRAARPTGRRGGVARRAASAPRAVEKYIINNLMKSFKVLSKTNI